MHLVKLNDLDGLSADRELDLRAPLPDPAVNGPMADAQDPADRAEAQPLQIHQQGQPSGLLRFDIRFLGHCIAVATFFAAVTLPVLDDTVLNVIRALALWTIHDFFPKIHELY